MLTAFFIAILIVPIGTILKSAFESNVSTALSFSSFLSIFGTWKGMMFLLCEAAIFWLSGSLKEKALNIYDNLERKAN